MVPTLNIDRLQPSLYRVSVLGNGVDMTEPEMVETIAKGLKFAGDDVPRDWALYVEVRYNGLCLGTRPLQQLADQPELVAQELVALMAEVMEAERKSREVDPLVPNQMVVADTSIPRSAVRSMSCATERGGLPPGPP